MSGVFQQVIPYCGTPPLPDALWSRWNLDPVLIVALFAIAALHTLAAIRSATVGRGGVICLQLGWMITAAALISPLCALSVSLFAARVGQHMILVLIAAPLVAAGCPNAVGRLDSRRHPFAASVLFAALLWFWHAPGPYAATFASTSIYWSMHLSLFGAAVLLWRVLLDRRSERSAAVLLTGFATSMQMGFLGALITLSRHALYGPHVYTTAAWGLTPLQDQQLGGALMWVPGCLVLVAVAAMTLHLALASAQPAGGR